jgi:hypothetical protein
MMKTLIARQNILFENKIYVPGEELQVKDHDMVEAWLEAHSAVWSEDEKEDATDIKIQDTDENDEEIPDPDKSDPDENEEEIPDSDKSDPDTEQQVTEIKQEEMGKVSSEKKKASTRKNGR